MLLEELLTGLVGIPYMKIKEITAWDILKQKEMLKANKILSTDAFSSIFCSFSL